MITAFYHVGGLNHWREIVSEQLRILGKARFPGTIHVHYGGPSDEQWYIQRVADSRGLSVVFLPNQPGRGESPVMEAIQRSVRDNPDINILYFHTKGAGNPNSWRHVMWRWMMNAYVLAQWENALATLVDGNYDWVGTQNFGPPLIHCAGGMWLATTSYLRTLPDFPTYYSTFLENVPHRPHWLERRHADEMWLGTGQEPRYYDLMNPNTVELSNHWSWCEHPEAQLYATQHGS